MIGDGGLPVNPLITSFEST